MGSRHGGPVPPQLGGALIAGRERTARPAAGALTLCYGTRPQVIKASVLLSALEETWPVLTVDTGQHYDHELNALLYQQLGVRPPHLFLDVGSGSVAAQTATILARAARVFAEHRPWAVVVIGDTNSTLGAALAAAHERIPVVHVEAGVRATDLSMTEEINRRVVDAIGSVLCAPSAAAEARLRQERTDGHVVRTGDIARDVLLRNVERAPPVASIPHWPVGNGVPYVFATLHRAELTDNQTRLAAAVSGLGTLRVPVVFAAHPRTRTALAAAGLLDRLPASLQLRPPLGYLETLACVRGAAAVVTDSGGVQREAYWLGTPCVTLRRETEWTETLRSGANVLVAPEDAPFMLCSAVERHLAGGDAAGAWSRDAYGNGDAAARVRAAVADWAGEVR